LLTPIAWHCSMPLDTRHPHTLASINGMAALFLELGEVEDPKHTGWRLDWNPPQGLSVQEVYQLLSAAWQLFGCPCGTKMG
jgi:hypothetical protein